MILRFAVIYEVNSHHPENYCEKPSEEDLSKIPKTKYSFERSGQEFFNGIKVVPVEYKILTPEPNIGRNDYPNVPYLFNDVMGDSEHGFVFVCEEHAKEYALSTSDSCTSGCICMVKGCENQTSLVHYLWDFRPEVIESRRGY